MTSLAQTERQQLCDLMAELGPDAPTRCEGWTTRQLAAHLVIRERRPDAALGILVPRFAGYTDKVMNKVAERDYAQLVSTLRSGPPKWSLFGLPGVDQRANQHEMFVHHEDVRRAQPGWEPRAADGERYRALESGLMKMGRLLLRSSPVTVRIDPGTGQPFVARSSSKPGAVTVVGSPDEVTLWCFGREEIAQVELIGSADDVAALVAAQRGM